jgi:hypothetical protein
VVLVYLAAANAQAGRLEDAHSDHLKRFDEAITALRADQVFPPQTEYDAERNRIQTPAGPARPPAGRVAQGGNAGVGLLLLQAQLSVKRTRLAGMQSEVAEE